MGLVGLSLPSNTLLYNTFLNNLDLNSRLLYIAVA